MHTNIGKEAIVITENGKQQILRNTRHGWQIKREELTPILKLNQLIGKHIGEKVREVRLRKGYTMKFLGELCGIPDAKNRIYAIEKNVRGNGIRIGTMYLLALHLECDPMDLLPTKEELLTTPTLQEIHTILKEIHDI